MSHSFGLSLPLGMLVSLVVMSYIFFKMMRRGIRAQALQSSASITKSGAGNMARSIARCWLAPTGVMAVFMALSGNLNLEIERAFRANPLWEIPAAAEVPKPPIARDISLTTPVGGRAENRMDVNRPKWIEEVDSTTGDVRRIVLSSKLWSTEDEARRELLTRTASIIREDFDKRHHQFFDRASRRLLTDERLNQVAVKQSYLEHIEQDFGTFTAPMCRLWTLVEVSPVVRTELYFDWKRAVLSNRVIAVGAVLAVLTLAANATALFFNLKSLPNRGPLYAAAVAGTSATAWLGCGLYLLARLCQ